MEVYGRKTSNLARACSAGGCPVTGISDYGTSFYRLVDGDTSLNNYAHTLTASNDWMMIDMQESVFVAMVRIYRPSKQPLRVRTFLKVYMELGS